MIDVFSLAANALWILGLAVLLAVLSWARWEAQRERVRLRHALARPPIQLGLDLGLLLFCVGLAATGRTWWERVLWSLLAVGWTVHAWLTGRKVVAQ